MRVRMGAKDLLELGRGGCPRGKTWRGAHARKVNGKSVRVSGGCVRKRAK